MEDGGAGLRESRAAKAYSGTRRGSTGAPTLSRAYAGIIFRIIKELHTIARTAGPSYPSHLLTTRCISPGQDRGREESTHCISTQTDVVLVRLVRLGTCVVRRLGQHQRRLPISNVRLAHFGRLPWNAATVDACAEQRCLGYGLGAMVFAVPTSSSFVANARPRFGLEKTAREVLDEACWGRSMNCREGTEDGES